MIIKFDDVYLYLLMIDIISDVIACLQLHIYITR